MTDLHAEAKAIREAPGDLDERESELLADNERENAAIARIDELIRKIDRERAELTMQRERHCAVADYTMLKAIEHRRARSAPTT